MIECKIELKDVIKERVNKSTRLEIKRLNKRDEDIEDFIKSKDIEEIKNKISKLRDLSEDRMCYYRVRDECETQEEKNETEKEIEKIQSLEKELENEIGFDFYKLEKENRTSSRRPGYQSYVKVDSIPLNELFYVNNGHYDAFIDEEEGKYYMNILILGANTKDRIDRREVTSMYLNGEWIDLSINLYINNEVKYRIKGLLKDDSLPY